MKRIVFFAVIGIFIFVSCKKEKFEPVSLKEKNDTIIANPPYWCVKSAVWKRRFYPNKRFEFEYDANSLLKVAKLYVGDNTIPTYTNFYIYEGVKLTYRKSVSNDSLIQEQFVTYDAGRIKTDEIKGIQYTQYDYEGNNVKTTTTYFSKFGQKGDTIFTTFKDYPDSSIAETRYIWTDIRPEPTYLFKEKLIKSNNTVILKGDFFGDTVALENQKNHFNPIIWNLFDLDYYYSTYTSYKMKAVLLDRTHNSYFYDALANGFGIENQNLAKYSYDNTGKINRITYGAEQSSPSDDEPPFPTELYLYY